MNISTIKTALFNWANSNSSGMTVVWSDQAAPRPTRPYVLLKLSGAYHVAGNDELRPNQTTAIYDVVGHRRMILKVQVGGDSIQQKAHDLNFSLGKPSVLSTLRASGISISSPGDMINLTEYLETKFEERFAFDVELLAVATSTDNNGYFDKTEISGLGETQIIEE